MDIQTSSQEIFHQGEQPDHFLFVSGRLCLDFAQTGGEGERQAFEDWHEPADLTKWFASSSLAAEGIEVLSDDMQIAYELREAIWISALAFARGEAPSAHALAVINTAAKTPDLAPQLAPGALTLQWASPLTVRAGLSTVARDALGLFASEQAGRIRQCANPQCLLLFVDTSHPGKRRWCSMQRCGNLKKTARYRAQRSTQKEGSHKAPAKEI